MTKEDFLKAKEDYIGLLMQGTSTKLNLYIEGKDDYNFYFQFFKEHKPNMIRCYRKSNVIKVAKLHNRIGDYKCIFFADRDFDDNEDIQNVFLTDFYNYESHIFSRDNISQYLNSKHSISSPDITALNTFLNSEAVLKMFHTEYERIKLNNGNASNQLIEGKLNKVQIDQNYNFGYSDLFTQGSLPSIETPVLNEVESYNGKHIGNLLFGIFKNNWFEQKFNPDMKVKDRKQLHNDMVIHCELPQYINEAISSI